jgi:hypothetical protein
VALGFRYIARNWRLSNARTSFLIRGAQAPPLPARCHLQAGGRLGASRQVLCARLLKTLQIGTSVLPSAAAPEVKTKGSNRASLPFMVGAQVLRNFKDMGMSCSAHPTRDGLAG